MKRIVFGLTLSTVVVCVVGTGVARDLDGRYANSPLKSWFDHLASGKGGNTRVGQRGSGHLAAFSVCLGGRLDKTGAHAIDGSRGEAVGKPTATRTLTGSQRTVTIGCA